MCQVTVTHNSSSVVTFATQRTIAIKLGVVYILRNQQRGDGGFQMLTVDYGRGGWPLIT